MMMRMAAMPRMESNSGMRFMNRRLSAGIRSNVAPQNADLALIPVDPCPAASLHAASRMGKGSTALLPPPKNDQEARIRDISANPLDSECLDTIRDPEESGALRTFDVANSRFPHSVPILPRFVETVPLLRQAGATEPRPCGMTKLRNRPERAFRNESRRKCVRSRSLRLADGEFFFGSTDNDLLQVLMGPFRLSLFSFGFVG
jgi:hypothetical protein